MDRKKWLLLASLCVAAVLVAILLAVLFPVPEGDLPLFHQGLVPIKQGDQWGYIDKKATMC